MSINLWFTNDKIFYCLVFESNILRVSPVKGGNAKKHGNLETRQAENRISTIFLTGDTRKIFVSKTVDSARVLIGCKPMSPKYKNSSDYETEKLSKECGRKRIY